ncbi:hypothetical protein NG2371_06945 [Nocardia gamkensis]|nr:hypothetical protein [Nocardia gamkensis]
MRAAAAPRRATGTLAALAGARRVGTSAAHLRPQCRSRTLLAAFAITEQCWARRQPYPTDLPQPSANRPALCPVHRLWSRSWSSGNEEPRGPEVDHAGEFLPPHTPIVSLHSAESRERAPLTRPSSAEGGKYEEAGGSEVTGVVTAGVTSRPDFPGHDKTPAEVFHQFAQEHRRPQTQRGRKVFDLKASVARATGGSNPSVSAPLVADPCSWSA